MKKIALTALAAIALPLTSLPGSATADSPPDPAADHVSGGKLAAMLSTDPAAITPRESRPVRVGMSAVRVIEPVRVALRPADIAAEKKAREAARTAARRVTTRATRSASRSTTPAPRQAAPVSGGSTTIASWYDVRPSACWDRRGRHAFPRGLRIWTAHKTLPCGTAVVVSGPSGTMTVRVWDRGPYVAGRSLDLSATAFRGVCGSTGRGVCRVSFKVA